jgi:hypothetical protein
MSKFICFILEFFKISKNNAFSKSKKFQDHSRMSILSKIICFCFNKDNISVLNFSSKEKKFIFKFFQITILSVLYDKIQFSTKIFST